jgi:hypothetical protein
VLQACGRVGWSRKDTDVFFLNEWIVMLACGRVVWSKYERPLIFPFKNQKECCAAACLWPCGIVVKIPKLHLKKIDCIWLVAVWYGPNMRDLRFFF